ncbi:30S ribosomal protein S20 [Corynebacterium sphenisci]|uniref:30S ribosomal protein S20 n=1 Tax=Corynebacterium sphenisci TaxID=191493 RepID=UPI0026DF019F|nr:30S ribosomal protein S20 [Corynebacterium sphenisci]MDO5732064.1 30S ribosomal protein S20 [Corynebacterium sphenisci]
MANIKSQIKRNRTNEKARLRNQAVRSAVRTEIRKVREAIEAGDKATAEAQLRVASRKLDKAVSKGVFHRNNAANKKSGLARAINKMEG